MPKTVKEYVAESECFGILDGEQQKSVVELLSSLNAKVQVDGGLDEVENGLKLFVKPYLARQNVAEGAGILEATTRDQMAEFGEKMNLPTIKAAIYKQNAARSRGAASAPSDAVAEVVNDQSKGRFGGLGGNG